MATVTTAVVENKTVVEGNEAPTYPFAFTALTSVFFICGFISCLNDMLVPHMKSVFSLSYTKAMLIQFCFFAAYFVVSMPAGALVHRIGYKRGLMVGLSLAGLGCLLFYPAASLQVYSLFLGAVFILASGFTFLHVSASPYVTMLGPARTAPSRLNLAQAFNSLGTTIAPFFGALLILSVGPEVLEGVANGDAGGVLSGSGNARVDAVKLPYLLIATVLFSLAGTIALLKLPAFHSSGADGSGANSSEKQSPETAVTQKQGSVWHHRHLVLGAIGIFVYVGAEVSIGSLLINFLGEPHIADLQQSEAAHYVAVFWGGAMVGRFIGSAVMTRIDPGRTLAFNAGVAVVLLAVVILATGAPAMYAILLIGLCNSIMFPTIFSLAVRSLGPLASQGAGVLCFALVGGALIPLVQGRLADAIGLQLAFVVPAACYLYILYYGLKGSELTSAGPQE